ncbi:MAG TPA: TolC family protein [Terriglobales bacterium]|nr:TolC family protein [Terriglobales bacterium]
MTRPAFSADQTAPPGQGGQTTAPAAQAPTAPGLAVDDVVQIALANHSSVKAAQFQVNAQEAVVHQQISAYYPTITFNNTYRTSNTTASSGSGSRGFDAVSSTANASMILYNFGKREGLVQSARDTLDATQYFYNTTTHNIALAARQAYYGVLQANALLAVNEETVKDREVTLKQTQGFYDVGSKPKSDVTQAEANLYLAQANLIAARNNVEVAWAGLRNAMGVDDFPKQPLAEQLETTPAAFTLEDAKRTAFAARPELRQFTALLKAQDELVAVARRNHLPDLLLNSTYGRQNNNLGESLFPLQPTWQVLLSFNIPIFNGFQTTYQVQQAMNNYYATKEQLRVETQQVALQVEQNYLNLNTARDLVRANEAAVKAAKANLDLREGRYQVGYAAIVEVTDAQTTYTTAQTNYVNSLIAYKLAAAQLDNAMGKQ